MNQRVRNILIRQSTTREAINALPADAPDTDRAALVAEAQGIEVELRDALAEKPDAPDDDASDGTQPDAEERERRELREKCGMSDFVGAAVLGRDVDGAAAEYAAAMGCPGMMPITLCGPTMEERAAERPVEHRAVTPVPAASDLPHTHASIVPALFDRSVAPFLGITMPTVGTGIQSYPVLSTSLQAGMKADDAEADEGAGAFTVTDADPRRLTGSFRIRKTDIAKLPNLESSLRENLGMVMSDVFDAQALNGNGADPNLNGVLQQLTDPSAPAAGVETYARYEAAASRNIDGLYATGPGGVSLLVGMQTLRHMLSVYRADEDATTAYDRLVALYGGVRGTRRIANPANNIQQCVVRRGDPLAVAPVWMGVELIRDQYGVNAKKGEITITATSLVGGIVIRRPLAFQQDSFRLPA